MGKFLEDCEREFFYLPNKLLGKGTEILPGYWGRIVKAAGTNHRHFIREHNLEAARKAYAPQAPSRYECNFCFTSLETARHYRDTEDGFKYGPLYRVRFSNTDLGAFIADYRYVNSGEPANMIIGDTYWLGNNIEPDSLYCEVLTLSKLIIEDLIE